MSECTNLPFNSSQFDLVVSFETIEHIQNQELFLTEISRVLRDDGFLIISLLFVNACSTYIEEANNKEFTILNNGGEVTGQPGDYNTKLDLIVNESITTESLVNAEVTVHGASESDKRYLKIKNKKKLLILNSFYVE